MILALRSLGVGDLAAGVPALRALQAAFPDERLGLVAPEWLTPLIDLIGGVARVDPLPARLAVNLHGSGPQSHRLLQAQNPAKLWAFASAEAGFLDGPQWHDDEHEVHRWCRLLRHYGLDADESDLRLRVPDRDVPRGVTIVHPGAKSPSRRWPAERYAAVAAALTAAGHRVVVTGSAAERGWAARVTGEVLDTGLADLAALVAHARLVISGDTGIAHLATAYGTPSVVLFGPVSPARWGPPPDRPQHRAIWHGTRSDRGDDPRPGVHPALLAVTVAEVLAAAGHG